MPKLLIVQVKILSFDSNNITAAGGIHHQLENPENPSGYTISKLPLRAGYAVVTYNKRRAQPDCFFPNCLLVSLCMLYVFLFFNKQAFQDAQLLISIFLGIYLKN